MLAGIFPFRLCVCQHSGLLSSFSGVVKLLTSLYIASHVTISRIKLGSDNQVGLFTRVLTAINSLAGGAQNCINK